LEISLFCQRPYTIRGGGDPCDPGRKQLCQPAIAHRGWQIHFQCDRTHEQRWKNGEPGIVFWDKVQADNPTPKLGSLIKNLCGEADLLPQEACCLGSINLAKFVDRDENKIIYASLKKVVHHAVRFLDDIIDASDYPTSSIEKAVKGNRKIGLGVMGLADMLFYLGIPYNSDEALKLAEDIMDFINIEAKKASIKLAEEKGSFLNLSQSVFDVPIRNASITVIAPTGSLSIIAETTGGIEPAYDIIFIRKNILGGKTFFEVNKAFEDIGKKEGWFTNELINKLSKCNIKDAEEIPDKWKKVFVTALDIAPEWHVKNANLLFKKHTTSSISKTVNLPHSSTISDVENIIKMAYDLNLKGITVFRDGSRSQQVLSKPLCTECEDGACPIDIENT
jgi:ribonucleoside-diphosphate reductase alpha chain